MIDVIWAQWAPDVSNRGYWDQGLLEDYFADQMSPSGLTFTHHDAFETVRPGAGAIVVIPARHYVGELAEINADLARLPWALVVLTGDEQAAFHAGGLKHPNMRVWIQSPDSIARPEYPRAWPNGYPPGLRTYLRKTEPWRWPRREYDWVFAGQVTHKTREDCATALLDLPGGLFSGTAGFTQGMPQSDYWSLLTDAKVAPCPSGPFTPDTFRVYEALEAGCVPVVDTYPPGKRRNPTRFWLDMFGEETFPVFALQHWQHFPELLEEILHEFPSLGYQTLASWMLYKRTLSERFTADITELSGVAPRSVVDGITVLMSTSPSPKHPSTALFDETLESVRERLPGAEVIVMADGVHSAHESLHAAYDEYLADMVWRCNVQHAGVLPLISPSHRHQASMARRAIQYVRTPFVLFMEHDTPLVGNIDFDEIVTGLRSGLDVMRLHHEVVMPHEHYHLMLDPEPITWPGMRAKVQRTFQWSQRPHVAATAFYERILRDHFDSSERVFIEDRMHSVCQCAVNDHGDAGWQNYRLAIYRPKGDSMQRSTHTDGRAGSRVV